MTESIAKQGVALIVALQRGCAAGGKPWRTAGKHALRCESQLVAAEEEIVH
jgi:hypothetical protein